MGKFVIYDAGSGKSFSLSGEVYLVDECDVSSDTLEALAFGEKGIPVGEHRGIRLDNYNMTNFVEG